MEWEIRAAAIPTPIARRRGSQASMMRPERSNEGAQNASR
jgi:hypothetical protein